ncbi:MAG: Efflux transporter, RND family, MFP subunit, partial [Marinimicrobia bacterium 46_47]
MNAKKKNNNMRITGVLAVVILIAGIALGGLIFRSPAPDTDSQDHDEEVQNSNSEWTCSMHPQIRRDEPGQCPICAMDLIPVETMNNLDETADPGVVRMTESAMKLAEIQTTTVKRGIPEVNLHLKGKIAADER